jgi:hypothetical protein
MKSRGNRDKNLTQIIEKEPQHHHREEKLRCSEKPAEKFKPFGGPGNLRSVQAGSTKHPVFMLGNAFPAKIASAFGTPGCGFPKLMIKTSLMDNIVAYQFYSF